MRSSVAATFAPALLFAVAWALLVAAPADAARKKRRGARSPLTVVVLPFVGKGTGGADAKEALELELELVETVQVADSELVERDLKKAGRGAWEAETLAAILADRGVDVALRGERGAGERSPDVLLVTAWGKDGRPRFYKELALGTEPDVAAGTVVDGLRPLLDGWRSARPIRLPTPADDGGDGGDKGRLRAEDVLVDDEDLGGARRVKTTPDTKVSTTTAAREDDVLSDEPPVEASRSRKKDPEKVAKKSPLDFNDPPPADASADEEQPKKKKKKKSRLDDDEPLDTKVAAADLDENGRRVPRASSIADIDDKVPPPSSDRLSHAVAISAAFDGGTWFYDFDGGGVGDTTVQAPFYPGGGLFFDVWPLAFAGVDWLGVDGELVGSGVPFRIDGGNLAVTPSDFLSTQFRVAAALKLRYTFKNGLGVGARAGYRYYGATVETQTIAVGVTPQTLTVVPGFTLHAASLGVEAALPFRVADHRTELELRLDGLPATYYEEAPDNPGATSLGFGWSASIAARFDIVSGFFVEARGHSTGVSVTYSNAGQRVAFVGDQLKQLQGGNVLNLTAGFNLGVGLMF